MSTLKRTALVAVAGLLGSLTLAVVPALAGKGDRPPPFGSNALTPNGVQMNAVYPNGVQVNAVFPNGVQVNGTRSSGLAAQAGGADMTGIALNGMRLESVRFVPAARH